MFLVRVKKVANCQTRIPKHLCHTVIYIGQQASKAHVSNSTLCPTFLPRYLIFFIRTIGLDLDAGLFFKPSLASSNGSQQHQQREQAEEEVLCGITRDAQIVTLSKNMVGSMDSLARSPSAVSLTGGGGGGTSEAANV